MGLPWVRFDTNMPNHDKVLALVHDASPKRWQAAASYCFSIMWSGSAGTDGRIPEYALASVHGTKDTARLLVAHRLWRPVSGGWEVVNYLDRQVAANVDARTLEGKKRGLKKANCVRWHGPDCGCWKEK